jgi:two-component system sensor histidine kinase HydH
MRKLLGRRHADPAQPSMLRPGYLAALAGCMALVMGAFAWYELSSSRRIMLSTLKEGAVSLVEAVARAGENALRADAEIEFLVIERLQDNARHIANIEMHQPLSDSLLARIASENQLFEIDVVDADGYLVATSGYATYRFESELGDLAPILQGEEKELVFGFDANELYAVALQRPAGGAIVVRAPESRMLALRLSSGTGRLIQEIGTNPGVVYMVLQDTLGIISASLGVEQMERISGDAFLQEALAGRAAHSRTTSLDGTQIFETVMPFRVDDGAPLGLLRVGLSMQNLEAEEARDKLQLALLAGLLLVLGAIGAGVVTIRQNYALLDEAYEQVQTYSSRILEQMTDAVVGLDPSGRIQVFNQTAEQLFEVEAPRALGRPYSQVLGAQISALDQALKDEVEIQGETGRYHIPSGRELTLAVSTSLIRDGQGQVETAVAVIQDLTEKVAMEAEMRRRDRLVSMGALASGVAHEVRNPLNAISLIVQRLGREFEPTQRGEEFAKFIRIVLDEVQRVNRIVKHFLSLARPPQLQPQEFELEDLLEKTLEVIAPQANLKGLEVERAFEPIGRIKADPEQLEQVLLNLLGNAVEATANGRVLLAARPVNGEVELVVEDTGAGIPLENMERIFDLYFTTKQEGTGLGLGLAHRIVSEHGGRIDVQSQVGQGTRFTIRLPRNRT